MAKKSTLKYILLGLIKRKPRSGYDLDQAFKKEVGEFWQTQHSQIYPELSKMESQGLIRYEVEITGVKLEKKIYSLTELGQKTLRQWIHQPSDDLPINRDEFILKIFFLSQYDDPELKYIIKEQLQLHTERLEYLTGRMTLLFPNEEYQHDIGHFLVLDRAISHETEYVSWLNKVLAQIA
ncbi:MAG: PadR family transcriptional regulator [[Actinobacillus] rossii]|nr:PadR family transcriptional regulator [[Actinobacillus] rossii]MDY3124653.1 PadR family transcriptional regulator [[Actinobacillus] rossii]